MKRIALLAALPAAGAVLVGVVGIGALHTAGGRQLMARLGVPCPVDRVSAAEVIQVRQVGLRALRGAEPAPAKQALGMTLGRTSEGDVLQWQASAGADCVPVQRGYSFLRCRGVPASAVGAAGPPVSELWFSFSPAGTLIGVDLYRRGLDDAGSERAWSDARQRMFRVLGAPARVTGDPSPTVLRASALQTARIEYRYTDYVAALTAVNLPHAGLAVREQYTLAD